VPRAFVVGVFAAAVVASGGAARADQIPPPPASRVPVTITTPDGVVPAFVDRKTVESIFVPLLAQENQQGDLEFTAGAPHSVQFELFFDRYEEGKSVREYTDKIAKLVQPGQKRPPVAILTWGTGRAFKCVLESFSLRYTLFLDDGTPVRGTMNTVWKEFSPAEDQLKGNPRH
jgi:hypothetical protein